MRKSIYLPILFVLFLCACTEDQNQDNDSTEGVINEGQTEIKIEGENFGEGPDVKFWFSGRNINENTTVDMMDDAEIGVFANQNPNQLQSEFFPWNYWYDEESKRYYVPIVNNDYDAEKHHYWNNKFRALIDMGSSESDREGYLVSYRTFVPKSYSFPGVDYSQWLAGSFEGVGSTFKSAWVSHDGDDTGNGDLVLWSQCGGGSIIPSGNGATLYVKEKSSAPGEFTYWPGFGLAGLNVFDHSPRGLVYVKTGESFVNSMDKAQVEWRFSSTNKHVGYEGLRPIKSNKIPLNHRYIAMAGWLSSSRNGHGSFETAQVLYGDIYVAQGTTAKARLEIGDAPNYDDCKWLFIAPPTSWTNNKIVASFYKDELEKSKYWFVTKANGERVSGVIE